MKRLILLVAALVAVAILAAAKIPKRAHQPEAPPGSWELAEDPQQT